MARLIYAPNQFDAHDGRIYATALEGQTLAQIAKKYQKDDLVLEIVVNGKVKLDLEYRVKAEDHITIAVRIAGSSSGGSKGVLRMVAMVIVMIVATYLTMGGAAAFFTSGAGAGFAAAVGGATMAGYIAAGAVIIAGTLAVNAIFPTAKMGANAIGGESLADSNTYGWNPSGNQTTEGLTASVIYGKTMITPQVISQYRTYEGNKDILNVLFHLTEGESNAITNLKVNNIAIADVSVDGTVDYTYRQGDITQAVIPEFSDSIFETPVNMELREAYDIALNPEEYQFTMTTSGNAVTKIAVGIIIPGGLYSYSEGYGQLDTGYKIEFRVNGSGSTWTAFDGMTNSVTKHVYGAYSELCGYANSLVRVNSGVSELDNFSYPIFSTRELAQAENVNGVVFEQFKQVVGYHDEVETKTYAGFYVTGQSPDTLKFRHVQETVLAAKWDVRVTRLIKYPQISGNVSNANQLGVSFIQEIVEGTFTYPYTSILGLRSIATEKVYGGSPAISMVLDRGNLKHYAGAYGVGSPTLRASSNPAWACYDLLTNPMYGRGLSPTRMVLTDFTAWANFCDTKGIKCNIYFDASTTVHEALAQIGTIGYGAIMPRGTNIGCIYEDVSQMVYTFGMGNIIAGTFNMYYVDRQARANVAEVTYYDELLEYDRRILVVRNGTVENENDITIPITLIGCTDRNQARKYGNRIIRSNIYNLRVCEFDADVEAVHCQIGDVVGVSHDVPQYGYSGRTKISTNNTIDLGTKVFLESTKAYSILIRHANDTLESKNIATPATSGDYQVLTLETGNWTTNPAFMSTWNLATVATGIKKFRIIGISKSQDFICKIKAIEYREEILEDGDTIPDFESDTLLESVVGLTGYANFVKDSDGSIKAQINADWRGVSTEWRVNVSRSDGFTKPEWNTYVTRSDFAIMGILPRTGDTYTITVTGLDGDTETVTVDMVIDPPCQVVGIKVNVIDQFINVSWETPFSEAKIKYYEVRKGQDFLNSTKVGTTTSNFISFYEPDIGKNYYWLIAVNEFDMRSPPSPFEATVAGSPNFEAQDEIFISGTGTSDDVYVDGQWVLGPVGNMTTTWEEAVVDIYPTESTTKTLDDLSNDFGYNNITNMIATTSDGDGEYIEVIDLGIEYRKAEFRASQETLKSTTGLGYAECQTIMLLSNDNATYHQDVGALTQIGLGVRYLKLIVKFNGDGNTAIWCKPRVEIFTKKIQQNGKLSVLDANAGLTVPLTVGFVDVNGINITPKSTSPRYAVYDFNDVPNPTEFTVWIFDENGTKVTGTFNYTVTGI